MGINSGEKERLHLKNFVLIGRPRVPVTGIPGTSRTEIGTGGTRTQSSIIKAPPEGGPFLSLVNGVLPGVRISDKWGNSFHFSELSYNHDTPTSSNIAQFSVCVAQWPGCVAKHLYCDAQCPGCVVQCPHFIALSVH